MPFDRLIRAVDAWAHRSNRIDLLAQISHDGWQPQHMRWCAQLGAVEFEQAAAEASLIIGHAGMGTILTAMRHHVPLVVMPRRGHLLETRNDHQVATARRFAARTPLAVAWDETELASVMDRAELIPPMPRIGSFAGEPLLQAVRSCIHPDEMPLAAPIAPVQGEAVAGSLNFLSPGQRRKAA